MQQLGLIRNLRSDAREVVRRLGLLSAQSWLGISTTQNHTLVEIEREGVITAADLSDRLKVERSTMSRVLAGLVRDGWIEEMSSPDDRRAKPVRLSAQGRDRMAQVHEVLDRQVADALATVRDEEAFAVAEGVRLYVKALRRAEEQRHYSIRKIRSEDDASVANIIRTVMPEFGAGGPGFAIHDPEVACMSAHYPEPEAGYFVVERDGRVLGGAGFAQLVSGPPGVCELRKMYFMPELRGIGIARKLMALVLAEAQRAGFDQCYLETMATMVQARSLYESFGFRPIDAPMGATGHFSCDAWYLRDLSDFQE